MIGFIGIDRGLKLLKKGHVVAFFIALFSVIGAGIPTAPLLSLIFKALIIKGFVIVTHLRFIEASLFTLLLLACKVRALTQFFRLMRPELAKFFKSEPKRFIVSPVEDTP